MGKKPVHSSHLALRFYKHDGWDLYTLNKYIMRGRFIDQRPDQEVRDYYWLDHELASCADMERLYENEVSKVHRWYDYEGESKINWPEETDIQYLKRMNW